MKKFKIPRKLKKQLKAEAQRIYPFWKTKEITIDGISTKQKFVSNCRIVANGVAVTSFRLGCNN